MGSFFYKLKWKLPFFLKKEKRIRAFREQEMEFLIYWMSILDKNLNDALGKKKISMHDCLRIQNKLKLIDDILNNDFSDNFPRKNEAKDMLIILYDKIHDVLSYAS